MERCKGMRDLLPQDMEKFRRLEGVFRDVCRRWGYGEGRTPVLEYLHLFTTAGPPPPVGEERYPGCRFRPIPGAPAGQDGSPPPPPLGAGGEVSHPPGAGEGLCPGPGATGLGLPGGDGMLRLPAPFPY